MPRPSSPVGTKAFTVRPYLLHHIAKAVTTSTIPQSPFVTYCIVSLLGMHVYLVFCSCCSTTHFVGKRLLLSNRFLCHADVNFRFPSIIDLLVGLTGLEPVTPRLSSACSNQLSYRPGFGSLSRNWWRHGDSNPGHPACKAGALPTELYPQLRFSVKKGHHARRARLRSRRLAVYTSLVRCGPSRVPLSLPSGRDPTCALPCTCSIERR